MEKRSILVFVMILGLSGTVRAHEPGLRLIETERGKREWMSQAQIEEIQSSRHRSGKCGGFFDITDFDQKEWVSRIPFFSPRVPTQQAAVEPLLKMVLSERLMENVKTLSSFKNRYYNGQGGLDAAKWIESQFSSIARGRKDITVTLVPHRFKQPSVIARIAGTGSRAAERVVIGAHADSLNPSGNATDMLAPGADDDASGVSTVLEAFRVLVESGFQPARTMEFMAYSGEEGGLLGSQEIAASYRKQAIPVYATMQFDMTMYPGRSQAIMTLINDNVSPELTRFTAMLIDTYVKAPWRKDECGYGCSDHASWDRYGFPAAMPFEALMGEDNPYIHTAKDLPKWLDSSFGAQFVKLALSFCVELASGD